MTSIFLVWFVAGWILVLLFAVWAIYLNSTRLIERAKDKLEEEYKLKNKRSNDIARTVLRGQLLESFVPIREAVIQDLNSFDFRPFGDFCDFIVIDGYTDVKDGVAEEVKRVLFMEVKSGNAKMSKHQEAVKAAIDNGRVEWKVVNVPANTKDW